MRRGVDLINRVRKISRQNRSRGYGSKGKETDPDSTPQGKAMVFPLRKMLGVTHE